MGRVDCGVILKFNFCKSHGALSTFAHSADNTVSVGAEFPSFSVL